MSYGLPTICSKKTAINFNSNVLVYENDHELLDHVKKLKTDRKKSDIYSQRSLNYIKKFLWKDVSKHYLRLIKNSF